MKAIQWLTGLVGVVLTLSLVGCGLLGQQRQNSNNDRPNIEVYHIVNSPNSRPMVNIGNAAINAPMYHAPEGTVENPADNPATGNVAAGPGSTPTSTGTVAGVGVGKFVIVSSAGGEGHAANRTAESDIAAALQIAKDLAQSQAGQTPTTTQREGTTTGEGTQTNTPTNTDTKTIAPNTPITGQGNAAVSNPAANAGGGSGVEGSAAGGQGDVGTPVPAPTPAPTPVLEPVPVPVPEVVEPVGMLGSMLPSMTGRTTSKAVVPVVVGLGLNDDGTYSVETANRSWRRAKFEGNFPGPTPDTTYIVFSSEGEVFKVQSALEMLTALASN